MSKKNVEAWKRLTKDLNDFSIQAGWFENTRYDADTPVGKIAAIQNDGALIHHPGGTPYYFSELAQRAIFVHKNTAFSFELPLTKPHDIVIPPRPFMDNAKERVQGDEGHRMITQELLRVFEGKQTMEQAAKRLGSWVQGVIQEEIKKITTPPLSKSTIQIRNSQYASKSSNKSTKPLNSTGIMFDTIQNKVTMK